MLQGNGADRIQHANSSPRATIRAKKRASLPHDSILRRRPISGLDTDLHLKSNDGQHGAFGADNIGLHTPGSISSRTCPSVSNSLGSRSPGLSSNGLPEYGARMFSSANPLDYPDQPMTPLESHNLIKSEDCLDANMYNMSNLLSAGQYDNPDVQIYGQLPPPYLMQANQRLDTGLQDASPPLDMNYVGHDPNIVAMNDGGDGWAEPENLDQMFGENWTSRFMNSGYPM